MSNITFNSGFFGADFGGSAETAWLWRGLLAPGNLTLFTSLWKSGKTTLLAHLLARRRHGGDFLDVPVTTGRSVVISEESRQLWAMRFRRFDLAEHVGVRCRPFSARPTLAQLEHLCAELIGARKEHGVDLAVFDSLAVFLPSRSENVAGLMQEALAPFARLAAAGLSVLLLHHPAKGDPPLGQAARGSGALQAAVDIFLEMRHPGGNPFTRRRRILAWSRYDETPRSLLIELSPDGLSYARLADTSDDFQSAWDTIRLILEAAGDALTRQEIRRAWLCGVAKPHDATLWRWLDRAVELSLAYRTGKGTKTEAYRYGLAGRERQCA